VLGIPVYRMQKSKMTTPDPVPPYPTVPVGGSAS